MNTPDEILADAVGLRTCSSANRIFDIIERRLVSHGASHILVTGLPMPGRPVEPLILHMKWPDVRSERGQLITISKGDPILERCRVSHRPFLVDGVSISGHSDLVGAAGPEAAARIVAVPVKSIQPYQAAVIGLGTALSLTELDLVAFDFLCNQAFRRLRALGFLIDSRPGDLSTRERKVLELTATGKTAQEIAELLNISQRTVHAHLQNAGEKLDASNKTQTVVEALRYGQITLED
ncbi:MULTISPECIES: helix-turn-helix transcriptional regulator [Pleomorphomonadaceae]|uniref:helix-turn-helix transcriptional regulator n=1 Tax=Pleomorphomonadaceae TaxID=2843308 RepID=UPI00094989B3|nr:MULTISPECIES: helix-turn-helix domain-containing protein [Pleomorphomonadaceae]